MGEQGWEILGSDDCASLGVGEGCYHRLSCGHVWGSWSYAAQEGAVLPMVMGWGRKCGARVWYEGEEGAVLMRQGKCVRVWYAGEEGAVLLMVMEQEKRGVRVWCEGEEEVVLMGQGRKCVQV